MQEHLLSADLFLNEIQEKDQTIDLSLLKRIGGGGTHDIYQLEKNPHFLIKVMRQSVGKDESELAKNLEKINKVYSDLYTTFSPRRCIVEERSIQQIKTSADQAAQKAIISIVPFDTCFEAKEKFGFNVDPAELDGILLDSKRYLYDQANRSLLSHSQKPNTYILKNYPLINKTFQQIFKLLDTDVTLKEPMREFLTKYKQFYEQSGILLDTIGFDNVLFYRANGAWQFKLGSVIKHDTAALTKKMLDEIKTTPELVKDSFEAFTSIFFMPACIRALNACALKVGMGSVIDDFEVDENTLQILAEIHNQLGEPHRIINHAEHEDFKKVLTLFDEYIKTEKQYDTGLRDRVGVAYWAYLKKGNVANSKAEVEQFLKMLMDPRNQFPVLRKQLVDEAIQGLKKTLLSIESLYGQSLFTSDNPLAIHENMNQDKQSIQFKKRN